MSGKIFGFERKVLSKRTVQVYIDIGITCVTFDMANIEFQNLILAI